MNFLPEKITQCPNVYALKLRDKHTQNNKKNKGLHTLLTSLLSLVKIRKLFHEKVFPSVGLSENIYNPVHTVNNSQRLADWQQSR